MNRRHFLTGAGAGTAISAPAILRAIAPQSNNRALIRPKRLKPGGTVGLITPATPVSNPDSLQTVARTIEHFGLRAKWGKHVGKKSGYFGNPVENRLEDLHAMFRDYDGHAL